MRNWLTRSGLLCSPHARKGIRERLQRQQTRAVSTGHTHLGELLEQAQRMFELTDKRAGCGKRSFVYILVDSILAIGFGLVAKTYPHPPPQS